MSLLDDLQAIDVSAVITAQAEFSASIDITVTGLDAGSAQVALGELGTLLGRLEALADGPGQLLQPLADALLSLIDRLAPDDLPLDDYLDAVRRGSELIVELFRGLEGSPEHLGQPFGLSLGSAMSRATEVFGGETFAQLGDIGEFGDLFEQVNRGVPREPAAFAELAIEVLLPFPADALRRLRHGVDLALSVGGGLRLPDTPTAALVAALDAVSVAAAAGDTAALQAALRTLERVRAETLNALRTALTALAQGIGRLDFSDLLDPLVAAEAALRTGEADVLAFLERMRRFLVLQRSRVDNLDLSALLPMFELLLDDIEAELELRLVQPVEAQVARLEVWLRGLLSHLGLRRLRGEVSRFVLSIADALREAELDRFARDLRDLLDDIEAAIAGDLVGAVQGAMDAVRQSVGDVLDTIEAQIDAITATLDATLGAATDEIQRILGQAVEAVSAFRAAMDTVTVAVERLDFEQAAEQVIERLRALRETAADLLSAAPLPENLRPMVEQLAAEVERIDLNVALQPMREAAAALEIPPDIGDTLRVTLGEVSRVLDNLIPDQIAASLNEPFERLADAVRGFDPSSLTDGISELIDGAASKLEAWDVAALAEPAAEPYQSLVAALDELRPRKLLAPVIEAYDSVFGDLGIAEPDTLAEHAVGLLGATTDSVAQAMTGATGGAPAASSPSPQPAPTGPAQPGAAPSPTAPPVELPVPDSFRPGDVVRLVVGYLPGKLREVLADVNASQAGDMLRAVDRLTAGLAADLRQIQATWGEIGLNLNGWLDDGLRPLAASALQAHLAVRAHGRVAGVDVSADLSVIGSVQPAALRQALAATAADAQAATSLLTTRAGGPVGAALERAATSLERCRLTGLTGSVDGLLAALDPEPLAAELDAFVAAVVNRAGALLSAAAPGGTVGLALEALVARFRRLMEDYNPAVQARKYLDLLGVLKEELELLDPRRLADELDEIHAVLRGALAAYDPTSMVIEVADIKDAVAGALRALDPSALLGDLVDVEALVTRLDTLNPAARLDGLGEDIAEVGAELAALDPGALIAQVNDLPEELAEALAVLAEGIKTEILALLEAIRYASGSASVSVSASVAVG